MKELDFTEFVDLASERLGGEVLYANDEFFAPKENLLKTSKPIYIEDKYTEFGKWMDGWETRRKREPGHDWCLIRLGLPGVIRGVAVDTSFFRGNFPEHCSIEACYTDDTATVEQLLSDSTEWEEILPMSVLQGHRVNEFLIESEKRCSHLRFNIYPDGGVARLRVYGEVVPDVETLGKIGQDIDLAALINGGRVTHSSDMFFGNRHNLIMPGPALNMSEGWETKRRRGQGYDWCIIKLCAPGTISQVVVDTAHFKGNYPESCSLEGIDGLDLSEKQLLSARTQWQQILPRMELHPDEQHYFKEEVEPHDVITHVRFNIYPDGGVSRLRLMGQVSLDILKDKKRKKRGSGKKGWLTSEEDQYQQGLEQLNEMSFEEAEAAFLSCCGSRNWAKKMAERRPFADFRELKLMAYYLWWALDSNDWLESFNSHPRIGQKKSARGSNAIATRWSSQEQSAARKASDETLRVLTDANRVYEHKFGFIFIVNATDKSAGEILTQLYKRLANDRRTEMHIAAEEQLRITNLRLQKLLIE